MDMRLNRNFYNETTSSDDEFPSDSSDDDISTGRRTTTKLNKSLYKSPLKFCNNDENEESDKNQNILLKLINRERTGYFSRNLTGKNNERPFEKVPSRLSFCLKDIVPFCYLQGHMFMGLTACGQFLISYKVCYDDNSLASNYNFNAYYKYTLYFWIYRPFQPLGKYFKVCLFDDHGVDNLKAVTMTQWLSHSRILIIHGASEYENEDSYITIVRVPKLGCLDCKSIRDIDNDGYFRCDALCIKCNLTIHTKYSMTESDPRFNPNINLICPERIIIISNGFIHMLHIELEIQKLQTTLQQNQQQFHNQLRQNSNTIDFANFQKLDKSNEFSNSSQIQQTVTKQQNLLPPDTEIGCDNKNNIIARIIADFSDNENETQIINNNDKTNSTRFIETTKNFNYNELIFTCGLSTTSNTNSVSSNNLNKTTISNNNNTGNQSKVSLLNHQGKRNHKIVTKSYKNGITTVDLQETNNNNNSIDGNTSNMDKASAYEFSEDTEKCEKIGTFRKRRLADKKYEFSEDNSENIIPFTKTRLSIQSSRPSSRLYRTLTTSHHHTTHTGTIYLSASSSQSYETTNHLHRASPNQGFRSPCGSPVGNNNRFMRSPTNRTTNQSTTSTIYCQKSSPPLSPSSNQQSQQLITKPINTLSPRQISAAKRTHYDIGNISPTSPFLSPRRDETIIIDGIEKPTCTKKFKRRFVEEDDATSVITSEEDDCISPGYHTSLPMEVHGSCYSDMQMISQNSYQKLKCPTVIITQHSFDMDTFTYHVISNLCQKNNKTYDVFYDWACELINVCPTDSSIVCILMAHFTARDQLSNNTKKCINCSRNLDCVYHRKQFECRILFTWNMETGDWDVLNYGQLLEIPTTINKNNCGLTKIAKTLALELSSNLDKIYNFAFNLRVLDSNIDKSKDKLIDLHNSIEFYRKRTKLPKDGLNLEF